MSSLRVATPWLFEPRRRSSRSPLKASSPARTDLKKEKNMWKKEGRKEGRKVEKSEEEEGERVSQREDDKRVEIEEKKLK